MTNDPAWLRENLAAYTLGALGAEERAEVERMLASNERMLASPERMLASPERMLAHDEECARLLADYESVLALLPRAEGLETPPESLRSSILAEVSARRASAASEARASAPPSARFTFARVASWAAVALVVLGVCAWNVRLRSALLEREARGPSGDLARLDVVALDGSGAPGASARLYVDSGRRTGKLAVSGLPALAPDRVYQLWFKRGAEKPITGGSFRVEPDGTTLAAVTIPVSLAEASAIAVTEEDAPGRSSPTGPHLLDLRLN